jgi:hypothetical protein
MAEIFQMQVGQQFYRCPTFVPASDDGVALGKPEIRRPIEAWKCWA